MQFCSNISIKMCYTVVVCPTQRRFLLIFWDDSEAETLYNRFFPLFIDRHLEIHAQHTNFFLYQICLIQTANLSKSWIALFPCPAYNIRYCTLMYVYIHRHTYVCIYLYKTDLNYLYLCFPSVQPS